ncbi:peptidyl-prolyl cis-trans isomerase, putative [Plasmodium berghei]|uniref:Peptidyl-prolyl cis-trans isomerase n=2 Tax=Plasmodium berghei TaxID=5821 RepID=A0A509AK08_PLABA|nr:peptidyl-prolyl cis-trans isomerase, putative [Plasmodium berghei ANKA]CXI44803.1 peptidyl-prolyl cis-trans isomerase, putative [Plasmodium berghei]SCM22559.1 peptidyl-prolyl cis-trans isomerase, putative [Plasmodium berghei]SCN25521.1 peptidyl-prolyl cis-trans isomerase, putative [Plasmodium berghei]SCO60476.1 peptidyl-prolyl cis-trans isomerase, putative [Plasmodium berghei]SCO62258.1 peptidyl-prolyl cis-trans isomerase, putative [Plasmodium berghei]|eukprot:XP_034421672.1 peptidyl-prolyl cis-trans isomerase, putative [Plasmodium berghei ANKA]
MNKLIATILFILALFQTHINAETPEVTHRAYFDISINDKPIGRIVFGLYGKVAPKTVENFVSICKGTVVNDKMLNYTNSIFHRIIPNFMAQGGDITNFNGTGGLSIYGSRFEDENFTLKHTKRGMLSMANAGRNTNGSQFFILFVPTPWLDGRHVVFGEVIEGIEKLVQIEAVGTDSGKPLSRVLVTKSGVL